MSKSKSSRLSSKYSHQASGEQLSSRQRDYYSNFFEYYASSIGDIFDIQAQVKGVPDAKLNILFSGAGGRKSILFITGGTILSENGEHVPEKPDEANDKVFAELFEGFFNLSQSELGVRLSKLGEGVYEFEIAEPRDALSLLKNFLEACQIRCCDPRPREIISTRGKADPIDNDIMESVIGYIPQQAFLSAASAQEAGKYLFYQRNGYPFSINYMEALLEQAENAGVKADLPPHLAAYRQH